jgi:hypothetical protein
MLFREIIAVYSKYLAERHTVVEMQSLNVKACGTYHCALKSRVNVTSQSCSQILKKYKKLHIIRRKGNKMGCNPVKHRTLNTTFQMERHLLASCG